MIPSSAQWSDEGFGALSNFLGLGKNQFSPMVTEATNTDATGARRTHTTSSHVGALGSPVIGRSSSGTTGCCERHERHLAIARSTIMTYSVGSTLLTLIWLISLLSAV